MNFNTHPKRSRFTREDRIKFIQEKIPNFKKINPYLDLNSVTCVRDALRDNGYYQSSDFRTLDSTVSNLILEAQGHVRKKRATAERD